jgi:hypothetical protein
MTTISIAIIKENSIILNNDNISLDNKVSTLEYIKQIIEPHITIHNILFDEMMALIVDTIQLTPELIGDTSLCYQDLKTIYQLCHLNDESKLLDKQMSENIISSYLVIGKPKIYGNTVLLCNEILENQTCISSDVTLNKIVELFYNRIVRELIKINTDGSLETIKYLNDPLESIVGKYEWIEISVYKLRFIIYLNMTPVDQINKKATILLGIKKIYGEVYVAIKLNDFDYGTIDLNMFEQLLKILSNPVAIRDLSEDEKNDNKQLNNLLVVNNFHTILQKRLNEYKDVCLNCETDLSHSKLICKGCFRAKYHSVECQKEHWHKHKIECLHNVSLLQTILQ